MVYNFALLTEDDTSASNMNFPSEMEFHKYYSNFIFDILPLGIIIIGIVVVLIVIRKIIKKIRRIKERRQMKKRGRARGRGRQNRNPRKFHKSIDPSYYSDYDYPSKQPRRLDRQDKRRRK